jgi:hypothetical protein
VAELVDIFAAAAERLNLSERQATSISLAWFDVGHWVNLMITLMGRREFRDAADLLPEIGDVAARLGQSVPRAHWLPGLAQVLDDEPVVVIDHATGRGFRLTMSGVGDNFQLHTLLADLLIGDPARGLLAGDRPAPTWVAAATTAPPRLNGGNFILRRFRLFDAPVPTCIRRVGQPTSRSSKGPESSCSIRRSATSAGPVAAPTNTWPQTSRSTTS